jgi:hypothetical protein
VKMEARANLMWAAIRLTSACRLASALLRVCTIAVCVLFGGMIGHA